MAESTIQRKVSDPEFTTQTVGATATISYSSSVTVTVTSATNVSSVSATASGSSLSALTFNVAKSGYTLVGITAVPASTTGATNSSAAYISIRHNSTTTVTHARLAVSGNTIIATFSSSVDVFNADSGTAYLTGLTCKYVKNN